MTSMDGLPFWLAACTSHSRVDRPTRRLSPCVRVSYAAALARWPQGGPDALIALQASHPADGAHGPDKLSNPCG